MKILLIGSAEYRSLEKIYHRAMISLGESVDFFDLDPHMEVSGYLRHVGRLANNRFSFRFQAVQAGRALIRHLSTAEHKYDVICVFKGMQLAETVLREGRQLQKSAVWVNINPDDPFNLDSVSSTSRNVIRAIPFFDLYCIWSRRLLEPIRKAGCKEAIYLPFGYDPSLHSSPGPTAPHLSTSVSFVGSWDKEREATLVGLAQFELRVCGDGWSRVSSRSPLACRIVGRSIFREELAKEIYVAAVSLNMLRAQNAGAHNMRTFEVPAMGGLLLTTRSEEQEEYFAEGKACLMFDGHEELREKIEWVLSNPDQAAKIRNHGRAKVLPHTYQTRARAVLNKIRNLRGERLAQ